jgi:hypothetical protein
MKPAVLYRIGAVLLVLFAVLHTFGFLTFKPPTAEGLAVRDAMTNVRFEIDGSSFSYGDFFRGMGLFVTAYLLFSAFLAWSLAAHPVPAFAWGLCAVQVAGFALSLIYISIAPALISALVAACVGWATWNSPRATA